MSLPSQDNWGLFCSFGGETQLFRNVLCFSRLRVLGRPTKKQYNPSDFVTLPNPVGLCLGDSLNLLAKLILACSQH